MHKYRWIITSRRCAPALRWRVQICIAGQWEYIPPLREVENGDAVVMILLRGIWEEFDMITVQKTKYGQFGNCAVITDGNTECFVTLDFGPRIIRYASQNGENMLFEGPAPFGGESGPAFDAAFGEGSVWHSYGGHRLWVSPEAMPRSYYPDNEPVAVEQIEGGARFTAEVQRWNNMALSICVTMDEAGGLKVEHTVTNCGAWPVKCAPWAITVVSQGGMAAVPVVKKETGLLPNRSVSLWPYAKMNDPRFGWGEHFITLRQDSGAEGPCKFGSVSEAGVAAYFNHGQMFVKHFGYTEGAEYPDGGVNFECYTNPEILEIESLGVMRELGPAESMEHIERWELHRGVPMPENEEEIAAAMRRI